MNRQDELLIITAEECAEVQQVISKILRFGIDFVYQDTSNRQYLTNEVADLLCMINLLQERGLLINSELEDRILAKREKLKIWSSIFEDKDD